jgi:hypothetical protein
MEIITFIRMRRSRRNPSGEERIRFVVERVRGLPHFAPL